MPKILHIDGRDYEVVENTEIAKLQDQLVKLLTFGDVGQFEVAIGSRRVMLAVNGKAVGAASFRFEEDTDDEVIDKLRSF